MREYEQKQITEIRVDVEKVLCGRATKGKDRSSLHGAKQLCFTDLVAQKP